MLESHPIPELPSFDEALDQHEQQFGEQNRALYARMQDESLRTVERRDLRNELIQLNSGLADLCLRHVDFAVEDCESLNKDDLRQMILLHFIEKISRWNPTEMSFGKFALDGASRHLQNRRRALDSLISAPPNAAFQPEYEVVPLCDNADALEKTERYYADLAAEESYDRILAGTTVATLMARLRQDKPQYAEAIAKLYYPKFVRDREKPPAKRLRRKNAYASEDEGSLPDLGMNATREYEGALRLLREYLVSPKPDNQHTKNNRMREVRPRSGIFDLWQLQASVQGQNAPNQTHYRPWYDLSYDQLVHKTDDLSPSEMMYIIPAGLEGVAFCGHYMTEMIRTVSALPADFAVVNKAALWDGFKETGLFKNDDSEFTLIRPEVRIHNDMKTTVSFILVRDSGSIRPKLTNVSVQSSQYQRRLKGIDDYLLVRAFFDTLHNDSIVNEYFERRQAYEAQIGKDIDLLRSDLQA